jgi:hypothetical protein
VRSASNRFPCRGNRHSASTMLAGAARLYFPGKCCQLPKRFGIETYCKSPPVTSAASVSSSCARWSRNRPPRLVLDIILDDLSAHENTGAQQFLEQHPRVRPYFTPTYSSTLTQVEPSFAQDRVRCLRSRLHYLRLRCGPQTSRYIKANFAHALRIPVERLRYSARIPTTTFCAIGHQMIKC